MGRHTAAGLLAAAILLAGCGATAPRERPLEEVKADEAGDLTTEQLDTLLKSLADRHVQLVSEACDRIAERAEGTAVERSARALKLEVASSAYDVVVGPEPAQNLVDFAVMAELEAIVWVDERRAERRFPLDSASRLEEAFQASREDAWTLCRRVMPADQLEALREAAADWRRRHPDVGEVSWVRFDVVSEGREAAFRGLFEAVGRALRRLNPVEPAAGEIYEARILARQGFYYLRRLPKLLQWRAEETEPGRELARTMEEATSLMARLGEILDPEADGAAIPVAGLVHDVRGLVEEGRSLAREANALLETYDRVSGPPPDPGEQREPFDIDAYRAAAARFADTAREATRLVRAARGLAESEEAAEQLRLTLDAAGAEFARRGRETVDHLARRLVQLVLLTAVLLAGYRVLVHVLRRRRKTALPPAPSA